MATLPAAEIRRAVRQGVEEDFGQGDATTVSIFSSPEPARAKIIAQQPLVVAVMAAAVQTFLMVDPTLRLSVSKGDADREGDAPDSSLVSLAGFIGATAVSTAPSPTPWNTGRADGNGGGAT